MAALQALADDLLALAFSETLDAHRILVRMRERTVEGKALELGG